jgi:hypothetical protein
MSRMVFRKSSVFIMAVLCFLLCVLSFVGGLALGLPASASEAAMEGSSPASEGGGGAGSRGRNEVGTALGLQAGRIAGKPIELASRFTQGQVARGGGALGLPPGLNAAGLVNSEVDRQARFTDHVVEGVNDAVRNGVAGQAGETKTSETVPIIKANIAPNAAQTMFTLELGAFHTAADAQIFAHTVLARGYPVEIIEQTGADGAVISRVESGRFVDRALAAEMQKQLQRQVGLGAMIVPAPRPTPPAQPSTSPG